MASLPVARRACVFYHHPCADGLVAMAVARRHLPKDTEYRGVAAGCREVKAGAEHKGCVVYFLDCAPVASELKVWMQTADQVKVIDHHASSAMATAEAGLGVIDLTHSAARLAWDHFDQKSSKMPWLVDYVEDNDLWVHRLPHSKTITAALKTMLTPETVDALLAASAVEEKSDALFDEAMCIGKEALKIEQALLCAATSTASEGNFVLPDGKTYRIAYGPFTSWNIVSQLGSRLSARAGVDFAALWSRDEEKNETKWSLRSQKTGQDVNAVARMYGGGGHVNAAGCSMPGTHVVFGTPA
jgi:oligoribonuclease NrnB/cAMP/cGMP phosphodiesterase (DHH superfamily)